MSKKIFCLFSLFFSSAICAMSGAPFASRIYNQGLHQTNRAGHLGYRGASLAAPAFPTIDQAKADVLRQIGVHSRSAFNQFE